MTKKKLHVKNTDRVMIIAGKDKGKAGNIKKVNVSEGTVTVDESAVVSTVGVSSIVAVVLAASVATVSVGEIFSG